MAPDPYRYFRIEARELLEQLGQGALDLEKGAPPGELIPRLLRLAHTLKGAAGAVKQKAIAENAHALEDVFGGLRDSASGAPKERINLVLALLDRIGIDVGALGEPEKDVARPEPRAAEPVHAFRPEAEDLKSVADGIAGADAQLGLLRPAFHRVERVGHLIELLDNQLASLRIPETGSPADRVAVQRARTVAAELQRQVAVVSRELTVGVDQAARDLTQAGEAAARLRLVPASAVFRFLERAVRDAADVLGKRVAFEGRGGDVRVDGVILSAIQGAFLHAVRNAVAHGIEAPADRVASGKAPAGRVEVSVTRRGRWLVFACRDDGRGIDFEAVRRVVRTREQGAAAALDRDALLRRLLDGGISTAGSVTGVSGRGIGMDVVREAAERLGGSVRLATDPATGTTVEVLVPASIASFPGLLVEAGQMTAVVPLEAVSHTVRLDPAAVRPAGDRILVHRDWSIPCASLGRILRPGEPGPVRPETSVFVVEVGEDLAAFAVDRILGSATVVTQPLPELAPALPFVVGGSLDSDGRPRLVLDPASLIAEARRPSTVTVAEPPVRRSILVIDDSLTTRMLEQSILESAWYDVGLASSAEEGIEKARAASYSLFLVDVEMPGMDGFTFVERIRIDPLLRTVPAILVTSRAAPEDLQRGREVGAQGYIVKGEFDQRALLERIAALVGG